MRNTLAMILAGGVGSRLNVLVKHRAKPAVPFGGIYRIIDFALSNVMNSGLNQVAVLTQYKPLSLMRHIASGAAWDFVGRSREVKILPPRTGEKDSDWYKGTADAVRQNLDFIESRSSEHVLILSGDHVYYMDYQDLVAHHKRSGGKVTVAMMTVPWEETHHFGIGIVDDEMRIVDWEEKPEQARSNLASMGIYVFDTEYLVHALRSTKDVDFGHHLLPKAREEGELYAYPFKGYWRDVGTIHSYWESNMDLLDPGSGLMPESWGVCTNIEADVIVDDRPPAKIFPGALVSNSAIAAGCVIKGSVKNSILSPGVVVEEGAEVAGSVLMHDAYVDKNVSINRVVCDKNVLFGQGCRVGFGNPGRPNEKFPTHLSSGLTLIGKGTVIRESITIGTNCIIGAGITQNEWDNFDVISDGLSIGV